MTDNRTTERVDHPPRVREAIDELMREKDVTNNRTTEKPVSGMRVWEVDYVKSRCPHCGWDDNRTKPIELIDDELWYGTAFEQECEMCGKYYWVEVDDDDR